MLQDAIIVFIWWATVFMVGAAAYPLTKKIFFSWWDHGYSLSKAVGLAGTTFITWYLGSFKILPFTRGTIIFATFLVFAIGILLNRKNYINTKSRTKLSQIHGLKLRFKSYSLSRVVLIEVFFLICLIFWSFVKAHEPDIRGLEKFMDYGFAKTITNTSYFPPPDMWYAGGSINYYYFGHTMMAMLSVLSGVDLAYGYNVTLAMLFALCFTMSFSLGAEIFRRNGLITGQNLNIKRRWLIVAGLLSSWLVTLSGNMQTIYAFTLGYNAENTPPPFWQVFGAMANYGTTLMQGLQTYWYANATRFIPFTIHEFPSYSFVVSDNHGHVLSIPFALLAIALLIQIFTQIKNSSKNLINISHSLKDYILLSFTGDKLILLLYGMLIGILLMTNALDGPIYGVLFFILLVFNKSNFDKLSINWFIEKLSALGLVLTGAFVSAMPFILNFKSFANGIAINCPPKLLENTKIGPIIFETIDKCQKSPLWMMWLLWGFFGFCGVVLVLHLIKSKQREHNSKFSLTGIRFTLNPFTKTLLVFFVYSLGLIIFAEFFYFKDIYPAHFRSNTMFKLGYQAFMICSLISAFVITEMVKKRNVKSTLRRIGLGLFFVMLVPQLFLVSIFPFFSVRSYFGGLKDYKGLYGLQWFMRDYPDDYAAMNYLSEQAKLNRTYRRSDQRNGVNFLAGLEIKDNHVRDNFFTSHFALMPNILEADGDSYTDYERISAFSGIPTIIGWGVHEWLWRGSYDVVSPRKEEVRLVYEGEDDAKRLSILNRYNIRYIVVGSLERKSFGKLNEAKLAALATEVFRSGDTAIYDREVLTK